MKHLKLFFALFAMLALGVGNAWGAEKTVSWTATTNSLGSQISNVNGTATGTIKTGDFVWNYTRTLVSLKSGKSDYVAMSSGYMQLGSSNAGETLQLTTSNIPGTIKSVAVDCWSKNGAHNLTISVGGTSYYSGATPSSGNTKSGTGTSSGTIDIKFTISKNNALYVKSITVVYEETSSSGGEEPVLSSIEISGELTKDTYEEGEEFDFSGLTVQANYESGDPKDVTNDVEWSYTPNPLTKGTTSVDVTATYEDKTATKTINGLAVNEHIVTPGAYDITLNNVFFGTTASTNITGPVTGKQNDITITINGTGSTKPRTDATYTRFYASSTMAISVPDGYVIKSIAITKNESDYADPSVTVGTFNTSTKTWTGNANSVTMSFGAKSFINTIKVTYDVDVKYALNITTPSNGTLVVKDGSTVLTDGAKVYEGTKLVVTPTPNAGYVFESLTVGGEAVELTEGSYTFNMPAAAVTISATFKENEKPAATLILSKNGVEEPFPGSWKQDDKVILPSITSDCVKEFVGWSADPNCATEPEYKEGDEYTLTSTTQTLYAVYATVGGGGEATASVNMATYATANSWGSTSSTNQKQITINSDVKAVISEGGNSGKYYNDGVRIYQTESATVTISTTVGELKSVKFTFTNNNDGTLLYGSTKLTSGTAVEVSGTSAVFSVSDTHATEDKGQIRFTAIEVVYTGGVSYSNYSTTCAAALANPTFSLAEGKYTEAKSVEIEYTEGTVYYTLDGTEPTASSTKYTGAIALNECGEYTIKAIAISDDSQSEVVKATYTIKLPLTNSQAAPYTEAEAIAVYKGGCYDNQDVYVKGTVKSAAFNSTYGNYTITLTDGFQFYQFHKEAGKVKFTEDIIVPGDVLIACGKLGEYEGNCQLAAGCYLVERIPYEGERTDISNTEATAYTVDQAFALIADVTSDLTKEVYVKGLVAVAPASNPTEAGKMTYSISDNGEKTGNVLKIYLGLGIDGAKFTSKNDVKLGDYVVVKGKLLDYSGTYELTDNQLVQHKKAATITIADITMEVGKTKTIAATVVPAEATVTYTIKENAANAISLSGNVITANAVGTATITATIATAADYMGNSVDFTVTVGPKTESDEVVILAELDGKWYAMKGEKASGTGQIAALEVTYFNGTLYNVADADKTSITWTRTVVGDKVTFANNGKYLKGTSGDTNLALDGSKCEWTFNGTTYTIGNRTFLYRENFNFKNYNTEKADAPDAQGNYSALPVVTAPVYATGLIIGEGENTLTDGETKDVVISRSFTADALYTISLPFALYASQVEAIFGTGTTLYQFSGLEQADGELVMQFSNVTAIAAATPYLIKPAQNVDPGTLVEGVTIEIDPVNIEFTAGATTVTMKPILSATEEKTNGRTQYWLATDNYLYNNETQLLSLRALFEMTTISGMPPRCRAEFSENEETALDYISTTDAPIKVIENGQLIIIRDDVKYNVQGVRL